MCLCYNIICVVAVFVKYNVKLLSVPIKQEVALTLMCQPGCLNYLFFLLQKNTNQIYQGVI